MPEYKILSFSPQRIEGHFLVAAMRALPPSRPRSDRFYEVKMTKYLVFTLRITFSVGYTIPIQYNTTDFLLEKNLYKDKQKLFIKTIACTNIN